MGLIEQAKAELKLINFGQEDTEVMVDILEKFFDQWDSGGAVWAVAPILMKCIAGKPLSPLTGDDSEWHEVGGGVYQNNRCSTVFKQDFEPFGPYDIDTPGRPTITFPYCPQSAEVPCPVIELSCDNKGDESQG